MDFRVRIEQAEREVEEARAAHERATRCLEEALKKLGGLIGVYHGMSAFDHGAVESELRDEHDEPPSQTQERKRAPKGEARRRSDSILNDAWPSGLTKDQMLERAAEEGKPIPEGTLRHALAQLEKTGRARQQDDLWFAVRGDTAADTEAAGAGQSNPAASLNRAQEDNHEAALTELMR